MSRLIALPVDGDAFILQRAGYTILVDGGKRSALLASELAKFEVTHLDFIVCTHADEDHAGGLVDFLDRSGISVSEFWLPGAWLQSLPVLLTHPKKVVDELVGEADLFRDQDIFNEKRAYPAENEINAKQIEYKNFREEKDFDVKSRDQEKERKRFGLVGGVGEFLHKPSEL
ncbi:MBL fold metallo-hydrolase [Pseudomonas congelans]|uniref:MBL fold metallo-hydrolase n=1 Tax=Pseudomonas congelans TaxID=200452 RepID=UPI001BDC5292|nr:MBL fold metallo-hydrolase [Pseudomonas congelans]QVX15834.1 MBL fold metallo-hydrolase [Pseudomonas congelans]